MVNIQTHRRLLETMKHYFQYEIHHSKYYLQRYFETCHIVSNITTNCPRAVTSVKVQMMMKFHYLPQNCTSSGRRAETKLSKFQQIDAKNVKNIQDVIHAPSP